ncbi:MAG TPA: hypothetical protein VHH13_09105 [Arthrobacter sp.]|nr:hypothetical protein [Arthrobacter sp.]
MTATILASQDLEWVDRAVIWTMYAIPLLAFYLWPRATVAFFALMLAWWISEAGDDGVWWFVVFFGAAALYNINRVVVWAQRSLRRLWR